MTADESTSHRTPAQIVVVTGAAGSLATDVLPRIVEAGWEVRAVDHKPVGNPAVTSVVADVRDMAAMATAMEGATAVLHLAGIPLEDSWDTLLAVNIDGTYRVLEAARRAHVRRVVLASSIHAVGFQPITAGAQALPDAVPVRPDTLYGVSKAAVEALGSLYADRHGLEVVALRIASRQAMPTTRRTLRSWLSPRDAANMVLAALSAPDSGFRTVWGVSANARGYLSRTGGEELGFYAQDDAEEFRSAVEDVPEESDPSSPWLGLLGGEFCSPTPPHMPDAAADVGVDAGTGEASLSEETRSSL